MASRLRLLSAALAVSLALGCDFGVTGESGCLRISQGGYSFPEKRVLSDSFAARLTASGIDFLTARIKALVLAFFDADASGRAIIPLSSLGVGTLGTSLGPLAGQVRDLTLTVDLSRLEVRLIPNTSPARLEIFVADAEIGLVDGTIAGSVNGTFFSGDVACGLANGPNDRVALLTLRLALELGTNSRGELEVEVLPSSFDIQDFALSFETDCDKAECLDGLSPGSTSECFECETICPVADFGSDILSTLRSALDGLFDTLLDLLADEVANLVLDGFLNGRPLVVEGEIDLAAMLGPWLSWMETARPIGLLARPAGAAFRVTGNGPGLGLDVSLDMGLDAAAHPCATSPTAERTFGPGPRPTFEGQVVGPTGALVSYELGLGLSDAVINEALWALWRSGALCVRADSGDVLALTGATFTAQTLDLLLPGVVSIAGPDAPIRISVLPRLDRGPDYVRIGELTTPAEAGPGANALLALVFTDAEVALDVMVGEAWLRMVAFSADLEVALDLRPTVDDEIEVSFSGVSLDNLELPDNELFGVAGLEVIAPFVVELALGFLASQELSFALPLTELSGSLGVPLEAVVAAMGKAGPEGDWLAIYVQLRDPPRTPRRLTAPAIEVLSRGPGHLDLRLPKAGLAQRTQVKVGAGPWSKPLVGPGPHRLHAAALWLAGQHRLTVRALDTDGRVHPAADRGLLEVAPPPVDLVTTRERLWLDNTARLTAPPATSNRPSPHDEGCAGAPLPLLSALALAVSALYLRRRVAR